MDIGGFRIEQLSEGVFEVSPGGSIQKTTEQKKQGDTPSGHARVGLDPVLIDTGSTCILLDTGLGMGLDNNEPNRNTSNILTNLEIFGYQPGDIKHVILSHLHYDHAAGMSFTGKSSAVSATLPAAQIYVQRSEWEAALASVEHPPGTQGMGYEPDDLYRLVADDRFVFLDKERQDIVKGVTVLRTGGHTPGHQIVRLRSNGESAYYCGDLIPGDIHLNNSMHHKTDMDPSRARKAKMLLMNQAHRENATLLFYHSVYKKSGRITKDKNRKFVLSDY